MSQVLFKNDPVKLAGHFPEKGDSAPDFVLTKTDLSDVMLGDLAGSKLVLNIFPSLDTSVCAMSVKRFNEEATKLEQTKVLCISRDLPFAHQRFCDSYNIENVIPLSELRNLEFGDSYGLRIASGPLTGLLSRAVIVIDEQGKIIYTQLVNEITEEPDYNDVLHVIS